jgi:hypothetical protein
MAFLMSVPFLAANGRENVCEISVKILHNIPEIYLPFLAANGREAPPSKIHTVCVYIYGVSYRAGCVCIDAHPCKLHTVHDVDDVDIESYGHRIQ